jgi:hypothetical protein
VNPEQFFILVTHLIERSLLRIVEYIGKNIKITGVDFRAGFPGILTPKNSKNKLKFFSKKANLRNLPNIEFLKIQ